jgi:hypothetical protein
MHILSLAAIRMPCRHCGQRVLGRSAIFSRNPLPEKQESTAFVRASHHLGKVWLTVGGRK